MLEFFKFLTSILSESEKDKLNTIINDDGTTSRFSDTAETQDKKEMYLPEEGNSN